ncbi:hypothetical protein I3760_07G055700 [Carya illinoinensis]|nr:hypothetical protein I3760_07G055700 [Carya illinoinensis]
MAKLILVANLFPIPLLFSFSVSSSPPPFFSSPSSSITASLSLPLKKRIRCLWLRIATHDHAEPPRFGHTHLPQPTPSSLSLRCPLHFFFLDGISRTYEEIRRWNFHDGFYFFVGFTFFKIQM